MVITVVSLLPPRGTPGPQIADLGEVVATIGHVTGYLLLAGLLVIATRAQRPWTTWLGVVAYGALIECVQGIVGLRSFQWTDILANAVGAAVGTGVVLAFIRWSGTVEDPPGQRTA